MEMRKFPLGRSNQFAVLPVNDSKNVDFYRYFDKSVVIPEQDELIGLLVPDSKVCRRHSDVWLLTNMQRIESMSPSALAEAMRVRFAQRKVSNPFEGLSDDELFKTIKSRKIQSLSELKRYIDFLDESGLAIKEQIEKVSLASTENGTDDDSDSGSVVS